MASTQLKILVSLFIKQNSDKLLTDLFEGLVSYLSYDNVTFREMTIEEGMDDDILILLNGGVAFYCDNPKKFECVATYETINILDHISFEDNV